MFDGKMINGRYFSFDDDVFDPYIDKEINNGYRGQQFHAVLTRGNKGGYICRLPKDVPDYHGDPVATYDFDSGEFDRWEWPIKTVPGKMCLITKDSDVCCGHATVTIVAVKDNYVIGKAEMKKFVIPYNGTIRDFIINGPQPRYQGESVPENWVSKNKAAYTIAFHRNGKCGDYAVVSQNNGYRRKAIVLEYGHPVWSEEPLGEDDGATVEEFNLEDWLLLLKFGKTADDLLGDFVEFDFESRQETSCTSLLKWLTPEEQELFDRAAGIQKKETRRYWFSVEKPTLIRYREFSHVPFVLVGNLCAVMNDFTAKEIAKVFEIASKLNTQANEAIWKKIGKSLPVPRKNDAGYFVFD